MNKQYPSLLSILALMGLVCGLFISVRMTSSRNKLPEFQTNEVQKTAQAFKLPVKEECLSNTVFQEWARPIGLDRLNKFLTHIPFYGMEKPLTSDEVQVIAELKKHGAQLWIYKLDGTNHTHRARYERGILTEVHALQDDYLRRPGGWKASTNFWSDDDACKAAAEIARRAGFPTNTVGIARTTVESSIVDGVCFYTVRMYDGHSTDTASIIARFRQSPSGRWLPTHWFNYSGHWANDETTDLEALKQKFFNQ